MSTLQGWGETAKIAGLWGIFFLIGAVYFEKIDLRKLWRQRQATPTEQTQQALKDARDKANARSLTSSSDLTFVDATGEKAVDLAADLSVSFLAFLYTPARCVFALCLASFSCLYLSWLSCTLRLVASLPCLLHLSLLGRDLPDVTERAAEPSRPARL